MTFFAFGLVTIRRCRFVTGNAPCVSSLMLKWKQTLNPNCAHSAFQKKHRTMKSAELAYYNESDRYCCDWLQNLMDGGHITPGKIDDRSIVDVRADDIRGYDRVHCFAGIGGWDYALSLCGYAGPVWTGSCPCQPFSAAGKGKAADDQRHLWPAWFSLIRECKPAIVFGEQVEAAIGWGWLDAVFSDLEAAGYACGAAVLPACSVGAPHIRQRVWFVGNAIKPRLEGQRGHVANGCQLGWHNTQPAGSIAATGCASGVRDRMGAIIGACNDWTEAWWLPCTDGKARPVEPGTFPLAHGIPGRVGRLRAYGNAIVPQAAAEFIKSTMCPHEIL
jgi:DNA (cytosine-5)-methyltransferase 1